MTTVETNGTKPKPAATAATTPAKETKSRPPTKPYTGVEAFGKIKNILARVEDPEQKKKTIAAVAALAELG